MPSYTYQAMDFQGRRVSGVVEAASEQEADQTLVRQGLYVIAVRERPARPARRVSASLRISRGDLIMFTVHLATVLSSGIPLVAGLTDFAQEAPNPRLRRVAEVIRESVEGGTTLSEAMAHLPGAFPEMYVNMVEAGEQTGRVDAVLFDLVTFLEWQTSLVSQIRTASVYPLMLLTAITGLFTLMVVFVLPRFTQVMIKANVPLPMPTQVMLGIGTVLTEYWSLILLGGVGAYFAFRTLVNTSGGRYALDRLKLSLPGVGEVLRRIALGRFSRTLETLYRAGVEFSRTMSVVERVVGNSVISRAIGEARQRVLAGSSLAAALRATGEFPPLVLRMIATGESSGTLEQTLNRVTQYYEREVPASVRRLFTLFESFTYIILGVVVLVTALSLYSPIYTMLRSLRVAPRF
jgi:type IV pilus assembly protein PilC